MFLPPVHVNPEPVLINVTLVLLSSRYKEYIMFAYPHENYHVRNRTRSRRQKRVDPIPYALVEASMSTV